MAKVVGVDKNSIAEEMGIEVGDELLGFNGEKIEDILDYYYYEGQEKFVMNMKAKQGDVVDLEIEKEDFEQIGLSLDESVQLTPKRCKNKCLFCFVDQLPKGMRETLYVKDDDYRLSFVSGNYVTFTNTTEKDLQRIVKLKLSPLYISVHAFDKDTKNLLVTNKEGSKLFEKMKYLADNNIKMHTQIVMCKDINDKEKLYETLCELYKLRPQVATCAIVPVGMTGHRQNLYPLKPIDKQLAKDTIKLVEDFNEHVGGGFCFCSDEFYIKADIEVPSYEYYGEFEQIENGVGLCREFMTELDEALEEIKECDKHLEVGFITGQSFKGYLLASLEKIKLKFKNLDYKLYALENNFFGKSITVAGLLTGKDIMSQIKDAPKNVVIPANMLREFTDTFLDGVTVKELEEGLNTKIHVNRGAKDIVRILGELQ